jgi:hypothetical protein
MLKSKWIRGVVISVAGLMIPVLAAAKTSTLVHHHTLTKSVTTSTLKHTTTTRHLSTSHKRLGTTSKHGLKFSHSGKRLHTYRRTHHSLSSMHVKHHTLSSHATLPPKSM